MTASRTTPQCPSDHTAQWVSPHHPTHSMVKPQVPFLASVPRLREFIPALEEEPCIFDSFPTCGRIYLPSLLFLPVSLTTRGSVCLGTCTPELCLPPNLEPPLPTTATPPWTPSPPHTALPRDPPKLSQAFAFPEVFLGLQAAAGVPSLLTPSAGALPPV